MALPWALPAEGELAFALKKIAPVFVAAINYVDDLAEHFQEHNIPLLVWEVDPSIGQLKPVDCPTQDVHIFSHRQANVASYKQAGFMSVTHLPLAAHPSKRRPSEPEPASLDRYACDVSFVGSSMLQQIPRFTDMFCSLLQEGYPDLSDQQAQQLLSDALAAQAGDPMVYRLPDILAESCPTILQNNSLHVDPAMLLGEQAARDKRLLVVKALGQHGIKVWGDEGWTGLEEHGVHYMGPAGHYKAINYIYSAAAINIDIGRLYQADIITMRVFDILACGGFVIAEHTKDLTECFEVGIELESWRTLDELQDKVAYYLAHPQEAQAIAARGCKAVAERHTIDHRLSTMMAKLDG